MQVVTIMSYTVYAIASGKGGVGKTTTAVNLGAMFAETGRDTIVVDVDLGMANLLDFLAVDVSGPTLQDVLAGDAEVAEAVYDSSNGLSILPGGTDLAGFGSVEPANLRAVVSELREEYDVILLDTGAGLSHDTVLPLGLADAVVLVTTPWRAAIHDTGKTLELTRKLDATAFGAVFTRVEDESPKELDALLDVPMIAAVPEDDQVGASIEAREPLATYAPESAAADVYRRLATALANESAADLPAIGTSPKASESASSNATSDAADEAADADEAGDAAADTPTEPVESAVDPADPTADEPPADDALTEDADRPAELPDDAAEAADDGAAADEPDSSGESAGENGTSTTPPGIEEAEPVDSSDESAEDEYQPQSTVLADVDATGDEDEDNEDDESGLFGRLSGVFR